MACWPTPFTATERGRCVERTQASCGGAVAAPNADCGWAAGIEVASHVGARHAPDLSALASATRGMDEALMVWADTMAAEDRQRFIAAEAEVESVLRDLEDSRPDSDWTDLKLELSLDMMPFLIREAPDRNQFEAVSLAVHELAARVEGAAAAWRQSDVGLAAAELRWRLIEIQGR